MSQASLVSAAGKKNHTRLWNFIFFFPLKLLSPPKQFFFFIMEETKARVRTKELALMVFIPG